MTPEDVVSGGDGMTGEIRGREAMRRHYERRLEQPGLHAVIEERVRIGPWIVDYEVVTNDRGSAPALACYEVADGLIRRTTIVPAGA